jgi:hypothetical protein
MARRGRPPVAPEGARTQPVRVYFTAPEHARLKAQWQATTCGTFSAFLRHLVLREGARLTSRTDALTTLELQRIGSNLNQIAKHVNSGLDVPAGETRRVYDELLAVLRSF